jgi:hypothetical protein
VALPRATGTDAPRFGAARAIAATAGLGPGEWHPSDTFPRGRRPTPARLRSHDRTSRLIVNGMRVGFSSKSPLRSDVQHDDAVLDRDFVGLDGGVSRRLPAALNGEAILAHACPVGIEHAATGR